MTMLPYLLPNECRPSLEGLDTSRFSEEDLVTMAYDAMDVIDGYLGFTLQYAEHVEYQRVSEDMMQFYTYQSPIRKITDLTIVTYVENGVEKGYPFDPTGAQIDRFNGSFQISNLFMQLGVIPFVSFINPRARITYTSGYDDGVQPTPDGVNLPYPHWLKSAARAVMAKLAQEYNLYRRGIVGLGSVSIGGISYSMMREQNMRTREVSWLPKRAIDLLEGNVGQRVWVGSA